MCECNGNGMVYRRSHPSADAGYEFCECPAGVEAERDMIAAMESRDGTRVLVCAECGQTFESFWFPARCEPCESRIGAGLPRLTEAEVDCAPFDGLDGFDGAEEYESMPF